MYDTQSITLQNTFFTPSDKWFAVFTTEDAFDPELEQLRAVGWAPELEKLRVVGWVPALHYLSSEDNNPTPITTGLVQMFDGELQSPELNPNFQGYYHEDDIKNVKNLSSETVLKDYLGIPTT